MHMHMLFSPSPVSKHFYDLYVHDRLYLYIFTSNFPLNTAHMTFRLLPHLGVGNDGLKLPRDRGVEGSMGRNPLDTVEAIEVLVACNLENRRRSLPNQIDNFISLPTLKSLRSSKTPKGSPRRDDAVSQEEGPNPVPSLAILGNTSVLVAQPVLVPSVKSC